MTKVKKLFKATSNNKSEEIKHKKEKNGAIKRGVSKPKRENILPGNLKGGKNKTKAKFSKNEQLTDLSATVDLNNSKISKKAGQYVELGQKAEITQQIVDKTLRRKDAKNKKLAKVEGFPEKGKKEKFTIKVQKVKDKSDKLSKKGDKKTKIEKNQQKLKKKAAKDKLSDVKLSLESVQHFDEEKFNSIITEENVTKIVKALKKTVSEEISKKKNQIFSDYRYFLNVICFKIPFCPKRMVKLRLKHPIADEDDDVCLIVKDLQRGAKADYETTIHHYEDLLKEKGIKGIKTIIPFNQLRKEYGSYEMKIKLSNLYDYILCDGAIVGHVVGFLGKTFQKSQSTPHAVRLGGEHIANEIEKAMHKTSYKQGQRGTMISIPIGTHKRTPKEVSENIVTIISQLKDIYPGGYPNIRSVYVRMNIKGTSGLPLYISMASPPEEVPVVIGPREQKLKKLKEDANKILSKFNITNTGDVKAKYLGKKNKRHMEDEDDEQPPTKKEKVSKKGKENNKKTNDEHKIKKSLKVIKKAVNKNSEDSEDNQTEEESNVEEIGKDHDLEENESEDDDTTNEDDNPLNEGEQSSDESGEDIQTNGLESEEEEDSDDDDDSD